MVTSVHPTTDPMGKANVQPQLSAEELGAVQHLKSVQADEAAAEWMAPSALKPWADNPRKNDGEPVARVAESIKRFGFGAPIIARRENREIIAGHTRWKAAQSLKLARVPVRFLDISEREAHLLALADNRLTEMTEWSETLGTVLSQYDLQEVEMAGWTQEDLDAMAAELAGSEQAVEEDEAPEPNANPVTQLGDVWTLGRHTLYCADSKLLELPRFDAVVTDPPYGVSVVKAEGGIGNAQKPGAKHKNWGTAAKSGVYAPIAGDESTPDVRWLLERADEVIIWGGNYFADQLPPTGGWLVWDKRDDSGIENSFADCELAWSNRTGQARVHRQLWSGMIRAGEHEQRKHPTQKPVALMAWCLGFSTGTVFDAYCGSGTTLIAAEQLNRACTAAELSPAYCDVIVERWQNLTGGKAQRQSVG